MINLYAINCTPYLDKDAVAEIIPHLDAQRIARVRRLANPLKAAQQAAAGELLYRLFGDNDNPPHLTHGSRGKPYLLGNTDTFFSLSHSGNLVFCAVAESEVGLDAQAEVPYNEKIAKRFFTETENAWLSENPDKRFTPLWVRKEAFVKFTGFGLVLPTSSFTVPVTDGWDENNHCCWKSYTFPTDTAPIHIAVCCADEDEFGEITIIE